MSVLCSWYVYCCWRPCVAETRHVARVPAHVACPFYVPGMSTVAGVPVLLKPIMLLGFLLMLHACDVPCMSAVAGVPLLLKFTLLLGFLLMLHARDVPGMSTVAGVRLLH
jgi:hypothetical protein